MLEHVNKLLTRKGKAREGFQSNVGRGRPASANEMSDTEERRARPLRLLWQLGDYLGRHLEIGQAVGHLNHDGAEFLLVAHIDREG